MRRWGESHLTRSFGPEWHPVLMVLAVLALLCILATMRWYLGIIGMVGFLVAFGVARWASKGHL